MSNKKIGLTVGELYELLGNIVESGNSHLNVVFQGSGGGRHNFSDFSYFSGGERSSESVQVLTGVEIEG